MPQQALVHLFFTGAASTMDGLRAMVEQVPPGEPWSVICYNGDVMALAAWAITLGGHDSLDLGGYHYDRFGTPTNADLVGRMADLAETVGRPRATPDQTCEILGIGQDRRGVSQGR